VDEFLTSVLYFYQENLNHTRFWFRKFSIFVRFQFFQALTPSHDWDAFPNFLLLSPLCVQYSEALLCARSSALCGHVYRQSLPNPYFNFTPSFLEQWFRAFQQLDLESSTPASSRFPISFYLCCVRRFNDDGGARLRARQRRAPRGENSFVVAKFSCGSRDTPCCFSSSRLQSLLSAALKHLRSCYRFAGKPWLFALFASTCVLFVPAANLLVCAYRQTTDSSPRSVLVLFCFLLAFCTREKSPNTDTAPLFQTPVASDDARGLNAHTLISNVKGLGAATARQAITQVVPSLCLVQSTCYVP